MEVLDTYSSSYAMPTVDSSQDVTGISGREEGGQSIVEWTRKLNTGDSNDKPFIRGEKTAMMFAWSTSSDSIGPHGADRVRASVDVFEPVMVNGNGSNAIQSVALDLGVDDARLQQFRFHGLSMFSVRTCDADVGL